MRSIIYKQRNRGTKYSSGGCCTTCIVDLTGESNFQIDDDIIMEQFSRRSSGRVFQKVIDNTLHVYFALPGVDKEKIKIRAKPDTMIVEPRPADQFATVLGDKNISLRIKLNEEIDPNELSATYTDGILITTAPTSNQYQVLDVD